MWSSFLGQIQQRIDDAANLLGDEEDEEAEVEEERIARHAPISSQSGLTAGSSAPQNSIRSAPQVVNAPISRTWAQGWDEEDLDDLIQTTTATTPPPAPSLATSTAEAPEPCVPVQSATAAEAVPDQAGNRRASSSGEDACDATCKEEAEAEVGKGASDLLQTELPATVAAAAFAVATAVQSASPSVPTTSEAQPSPPPGGAAEEPACSSLPSLDTAAVADGASAVPSCPKGEPEAPAEEQESARDSATQDSSSPEVLAAAAAPLPPETGPMLETVQEATAQPPSPSPPPPAQSSDTVKESSDVAQLLRFQQQLAEEMECVASLQKENTFLKGRVSALEGELSSANARLVKAAGNEEQIALLIEKLGKEKERHRAAANGRRELEERMQDLEEELEEYRVKEQGWIGGSEQQKQNENAAQQRIAQLERDLRARDTLTEDLNAKLCETAHQNSVLQRQVEELKASYSIQLDRVKETNSDTVDQLRSEVEQLRSSLQNLSTEYDARTAELEREVQQSNMRAHQAEARFSEAEFGSVTTLQDLRGELEDSQRSIAAWKAESQKTRSEYTELLDQYALLKRSRAAAESDLRERLAAESSAVAELRKDLQKWEARYEAQQEALREAQSESDEQKKTIMLLEAANQKLKTATTDILNRSQSDVSVNSPAPTKGSSLEMSLMGSPFTSRTAPRGAAAAVPLNPFVNRERPVWNDTTDRKTRERLEQEVLRQSTEVERLRQVANENAEWKNKFLQLQTEHDLLLQLYGQLEDEVSSLKRSSAAPSPGPAPATSETPTTAPQ
ncbi:hypothetical protein NQL31_000030 [Lotmaria passim]